MQSETLIEKALEEVGEEIDWAIIEKASEIVQNSRNDGTRSSVVRDENKIALMRRQCSLQKDQNKLLALLIRSIEAQNSQNPHFMGVNAIKAHKIIQNYDY